MPDLPPDNPLYDFFKQFRKGMPQAPTKPAPSLAQGSGFFITPDGFVVTNNHVVEDAEDITVTLDNGEKYPAKLIGNDPRTDVALVKVTAEGKTFPFVEFSSKDPRVGDWVLAVGNPFGLGGTVTAGIISAHNRDIGSGPYDYLQIDAAVNRGNSGGPSFDLDGNVVGMNTAIFSPSGGNVGIAFAVPAALVKEVVTQLQTHGTVDRGWLGVVIQNVSEDIADSIGMSEAKGAMITKVTEDGPAAKEDLKPGDVIVEVNGEKIDDSRDLARKIAELQPDTDVNLKIVRYGEKRDLSMKLGTFPSGKKLAALEEDKPADTGEQMKNLGLSLAPATKFPGAGDEGVVITEVDPASDAADKGLKPGDVILQVAGVTVSSPSDVAAGVKKAIDGAKTDKDTVKVLMQVKSGDQTRFVALSLKKA
jgi:serine protease Do